MSKSRINREIKLGSKRNVELWIYSFADMYMIISVFFIAISVLYAAKLKENLDRPKPLFQASAGRGLASVQSDIQIEFATGANQLTENSINDLKLILPALKNLDKNSFIEVEGYADKAALKKGSAFSSNLALSQSRAVQVSEWLINHGVPVHKLRTTSFGDGRIWPKDIVGTNKRVLVRIATAEGNYEK